MDSSDEAPGAIPVPEPEAELDVDEEQRRLDQLGEDIEATARRAEEDLEMGGPGRTFTDRGVGAQVEQRGDTDHPLADR